MAEETLRLNLTAQDRMSGVVKGTSSAFDGMVSKIGAAAAAYLSLRTIQREATKIINEATDALKAGIKESIEWEQASIRLGQALKSNNVYTEESYQFYLANAEALQKLTNFTDDEVLAAEAMLATFKMLPDKLRLATQLSLDFAAATGTDLVQAATVVGKAFSGATGTLSRWGIIIDENDLKARGYLAVADKLKQSFGGQAQEAIRSYAGALGMVKKGYASLLQETAAFITESPGVRAAYLTLAETLFSGADAMAALRKEHHDLVTEIVTVGIGALVDLAKTMDDVSLMAWVLRTGIREWWDQSLLNKIQDALGEAHAAYVQAYTDVENLTKAEGMSVEQAIEMARLFRALGVEGAPTFWEKRTQDAETFKAKYLQILAELEAAQAKPTGFKPKVEGASFVTENMRAGLQTQNDLLQQAQFQYQNILTMGAAGLVDTRTATEIEIDEMEQKWDELSEYWAFKAKDMGDSAEREFLRPVYSGMEALSDRLADAMFDTKTQFKDIWKQMFKDAMSQFFLKVAFKGVTTLLGLPFFSTGGEIPAAQHGLVIPGPAWDRQDNRLVMGHPGEVMIPRPVAQRHSEEISDLLREARTGAPAARGGASIVHQHQYFISAWDADSVRQAFRHGRVQREAQLAIDGGYLET